MAFFSFARVHGHDHRWNDKEGSKFIERIHKLKNSVQSKNHQWFVGHVYGELFCLFRNSKDSRINCRVCAFFSSRTWIEIQWLNERQYNEYLDYLFSQKLADDLVFINGWPTVQHFYFTEKGVSFFVRSLFSLVTLFIRPSINHPAHFQFSSFRPFSDAQSFFFFLIFGGHQLLRIVL